MAKYLGEFEVDIKNTPYAKYSKVDWAMKYNFNYGGIDGSHHKTWVLDQMSRILKGTPVIVTLAKWDDGKEELRFNTGEPSKAYLKWVKKYKGKYIESEDYTGYEYNYDEGIAP